MRSAVDRIFDLLEALTARPEGVSLGELAKTAKLSRPTAHRLLTDMARRGLLQQFEPNGAYALTLELSMLGFRNLAALGFLDLCQPELDAMAVKVGELVRLSWLDGGRPFIVAESQGAKPGLRFDANLGRPVVLHAMAVGKVFLAHMPRAQAIRLVREQGALGSAELGPNAIAGEAELDLELSRVERQGFAIAFDEAHLGASAVAAPIIDQAGRYLGAVAVVAPTARWTRTRLGALAPELRRTAEAIAAKSALAPYCLRGKGAFAGQVRA